jgi:hypothetical protein
MYLGDESRRADRERDGECTPLQIASGMLIHLLRLFGRNLEIG